MNISEELLPDTIKDMRAIEIELATEEDLELVAQGVPLLSYSSTTNYHVCPTLGVVGKSCGKSMYEANGKRKMELEAGKVAHEVFAALRIYQLIKQDYPAHAWYHAERIFGEVRREQLWDMLDHEDENVAMYNFALEALYTSGFHDDMYDKKRTFANVEETLIDYINSYEMDKYPVFVLDPEDHTAFVGIEVPCILKITYVSNDGTCFVVLLNGFLDGLHYDAKNLNRLIVNENKTASNISDSWKAAFQMDHQVTIYALMVSLIIRREVNDVHVYGSPIPLGRNRTALEPVKRNALDNGNDLLTWLWSALRIHYMYKDAPLTAPRYTHSCSRYFRTCSLMPLCSTPESDRQEMFESLYERDEEHIKNLIAQYKSMLGTYLNIQNREVE